MSGSATKRMIEAYVKMSSVIPFLSGFFQSPQRNFHNSEEVEIDIIRDDEELAIAIQDISTGYRFNSDDQYTNKSFAPPILKEAFAINSFKLLKRGYGKDPFQNNDFRVNLIERLMIGMAKIERKIRRTIELQAAQILQDGAVTLVDLNGNEMFSINFNPKGTHFVTAGTAWNAGGATIADDISAISEVIRNDGLEDPDQLIMGIDAFEAFIKDSDIQDRFDNRRIDLGTIAAAEVRGSGATFRGTVDIGNYRYQVWTYGGRYIDPQTQVKTQYIDPANVIVRSSAARMDATFGSIPNIGKLLGATNKISLPMMPSRFSIASTSIDLNTNIWLSEDGENLFSGVGTRPLLYPTAIDTFGRIATGV